MKLGLLALAAAALLSGGCGSGPHGTATLWVTRDRGARVLLTRKVPAGLTAMQALDRVADIKTRYGGRFVQAIDGVSGSLSARRDWFYFINGYEADRGAAEYRLRDGDVEWWDYRAWRDPSQDGVVVGAFPEPFLHGYNGTRPPAVVISAEPAAGRMLARLLHGRWLSPATPPPPNANVLVVHSGRTRFAAALVGPAVRMTFSGDWHLLLRGRYPFRFRYSVG